MGSGPQEGAPGLCWVAAVTRADSDDMPPWCLTALSVAGRSSGQAPVMTAPTTAVRKVPRSVVCRRAVHMLGGTSVVHAMAVATAAKGVAPGRAATGCHSCLAHRW